jgi:plasmid stability protein
MAQLLVRNVDPSIVRKLKSRANDKGISMEEEHRRILKEYVNRPETEKPSLMQFLLQGDGTDIDLDIDRSRQIENREIGF